MSDSFKEFVTSKEIEEGTWRKTEMLTSHGFELCDFMHFLNESDHTKLVFKPFISRQSKNKWGKKLLISLLNTIRDGELKL